MTVQHGISPDRVEKTLEQLLQAGFDQAMVVSVHDEMDELSINHNQPSMLRSTQSTRLQLTGILDGRKASTALTHLTEETIASAVSQLKKDALLAPQDSANQVSTGQRARVEKGPQAGDRMLLTERVRELLAFRQRAAPTFLLEEGQGHYQKQQTCLMTSGGSLLESSIGCYGLGVLGSAKDGSGTSSYNETGGATEELSSRPAEAYFGIGDMMRDSCLQTATRPLGEKFVGEVILTPKAVMELLFWLIDQLTDTQLLTGSSLYRGKVGERVAASALTIASHLEGAGASPFTSDGFVAERFTLMESGTLNALLPSLYASRKLGLVHRPCDLSSWSLSPGETTLEDLTSQVKRGALVGRLSMGQPAPNGDFAGVIKNSFLVENGEQKGALAEVMISGNVAQMMNNIEAISRESLDFGELALPWLRISGLSFS